MGKLDFLIKGALPEKRSPIAKDGKPIHQLLEGEYSSQNQQVFVTRVAANPKTLPGLCQEVLLPEVADLIWRWAGVGEKTIPIDQLLFIDTETTGLSGGTGTLAFMVGLGFFRAATFVVEQYFMTDPASEAELVRVLTDKLKKSSVLVSFNGKSFDLPLLETRWILQGEAFNPRVMPQLDLLPLARRLWGRTLPGCSLQQLEDYVLHSGREAGTDIPGSQIPQLYFDYLRNGDASDLKNVFYHNRFDMVSMVLLLHRISQIIKIPTLGFTESRIFLPAVARLLLETGETDRALELYRFCVQEAIESSQSIRELSFLHKRSGHLAEAQHLWELARQAQETYAHIELAKVAEHRDKAYTQALILSREALEIELSRPDKLHALIGELEHRIRRLERKLSSCKNLKN